ncbi:MAG: DUF4301 family protein [Prevotellaceae bacterium]|nr:DUF4301 family protein [Candidatus Colivivens equi]
MFTSEDKKIFALKGISEDTINHQLSQFHSGFPFLRLKAAASTTNGGIKSLSVEQSQNCIDVWQEYLKDNHTILKFVPASGAASRMFKNLFEFLTGDSEVPNNDFIKTFFDKIEHYAFFDALNDACIVNNGLDIDALIKEGKYKAIIENLLGEQGLSYGNLPKGLLFFHSYDDCVRTPLEEHLVEGALYATDNEGNVKIHFTVSAEHKPLFEDLVVAKLKSYEEEFGVHYTITFSEQKSNTDTIAATTDNQPFRNEDGSILFRPGGHGALIENLNDIDADVIFIKNIDNVVPDKFKSSVIKNKKMLAGYLVSIQQQIFDYIRQLRSNNCSVEKLDEIKHFLSDTLCCTSSKADTLTETALIDYLLQKLNRPIRVCGMVKNVGEPGGGPFFAYNSDGSISLQILESSQIDTTNKQYQEMFLQGTHFNPVDLVCAIKDVDGNPFNLIEYVDPQTGFISHKSKNGRELKALELPGLWNGAMSDWNTLFVEVPLDTFNPVKTVNDLIRPQHQ